MKDTYRQMEDLDWQMKDTNRQMNNLEYQMKVYTAYNLLRLMRFFRRRRGAFLPMLFDASNVRTCVGTTVRWRILETSFVRSKILRMFGKLALGKSIRTALGGCFEIGTGPLRVLYVWRKERTTRGGRGMRGEGGIKSTWESEGAQNYYEVNRSV
ncbi:unnamed protein product [Nesidiocoris tenuis]|uniref:Uncharacterized protein n=1 Tax=Nesidiocoris tenuis TaxID=355587 RepID=A0A6H5HF48_9HEMI|nr:unnamed protein product [Nesidiocoris tenuis]